MIFGNKRRIASLVLIVCLLFNTEFDVMAAYPQSEARIIETINYGITVEPLDAVWEQIPVMAGIAVNTQDWHGKALANTDSESEVYAEAGGVVIGKMYKSTIVNVIEKGEEWSQISSGTVVGFVRNESLLFGSAAVERAAVVCADGTKEAKTIEELNAEKKRGSVEMLAALIYCEAGNQPYDGKVAVGSIVMNRIASGRFPNTLEGVIYQNRQFTPVSTGKFARILAAGNVPSSCYQAAEDAMNGAKPVGSALFFSTGGGGYKLGDHYFR